MKVFITRNFPQAGLQLLKEAGILVTHWKESRELTQQELIDNARRNDALIVAGSNRINKVVLNECNHLKVISLLSVGYDNVDIQEATRLRIPIGNTPDVVSAATADIAFLLMIVSSRKAFYLHKKIENGEWVFADPTADLGIELQHATLGIFGLGRIGLEMAKRCKGAFNMKVIYHNKHRKGHVAEEVAATFVSFDELLIQSDVLSVHASLTPETENKFNKAAFDKMKPRSIFINTARGSIHNEADLIEALEKGTIWGAGLDVTNPEPMSEQNPLLRMPTVAVLPHVGSGTVETRDAMAILASKNVIAGLENKRLPNVVNPDVYL